MKLKKIFLVIFGFLTSLFSVDDFESFLNDNSGRLILPSGGRTYIDEEWLEYQRLKIDESVGSINPEDLPEDFCAEACRLVDEFHNKTVNEKVEWMLYFDYTTGEVIYCWKGNSSECGGDFNRVHFHNKKIASIHNHVPGYYSVPSPDNFDILENDFEDYEIITSVNAFWVVEFKGFVKDSVREDFQTKIAIDFHEMENEIKLEYANLHMVRLMSEKLFSGYLLNDIHKMVKASH